MEKRAYKAKSKDENYLFKYQVILDDVGTLHRYAVDWVRKHDVFEDERAIHAMAYSIWAETMKIMNIPGLIVQMPEKELPAKSPKFKP